jgi:two-component system sensor histidine kinase TctE
VSGRTLRAKLLWWLLVPLGALAAVDALSTWYTLRRAIDAAYDRALYASALAISERLTLDGATTPAVDIPPVALEVLDATTQERIFYRVAWRVGGGEEQFLTGYPDLPRPPRAPGDAPVFYAARYRGDDVRIAALATSYPTEPPIAVTVQVAETVVGRGGLTHDLVGRVLAAQLAMIALAAVIVAVGVARGLRPLERVSAEVAHRSATDLAEVEPRAVPREVAPLVAAVNGLMGRVRQAVTAQRRFIADAAHALRTPLAVLRTEAEIALREQDPGALRGALARVRDHSAATSHLAAQLLALARAESAADTGRAERVDVVALAGDACAALVPEAIRLGHDLGFEGTGEAHVLGRDHQVREIVHNLVTNAMKHGGPGARITVSVDRTAAGEVRLAVEDDGPGIPAGERERVLRPFHRLPGAGPDGAGLGLAIVSEIARSHGATLHLLDGASGRGLRVEVRFPAADRERPVTGTAA